MKDNLQYQTNSKGASTLLVITFCVVVFIPLLLLPFLESNSGGKLANENRLAASWPAIQELRQSITGYTSQINTYLEDHIPGRQHLLDFYSSLYFKVMRSGSDGGAVIGKDQWLFLGSSNNIENARGVIPMDREDAADWAHNASIINDVVTDYGGKFLIVIVPDKAQVYPEYLPDHIVYQRTGRRADTLVNALQDARLPHLDLLDLLVAAKENHASPVYFKTDSHWSYIGALDAYQATIQKLNSFGERLPIVERLQLRVILDEDFSGDLARLINLEEYFYEDHFFLAPFREKEKFTREKKLLMLADSFIGNQLEYFHYSFIETTCIHHDWGNIDLDLIREQQADVVILQMIERGLEFSLSVNANSTRSCGNGF